MHDRVAYICMLAGVCDNMVGSRCAALESRLRRAWEHSHSGTLQGPASLAEPASMQAGC